ncbi:hypothetical protein PK35_00520 [Tamlana nanhaiensis]|uniref:DUF5916 domain-containing protein n=2 Tax=Neotamlana nanhaiensis TaxID=1382798 RepID=A0A0D7W6Y8_9FLAO|nr:hypothetical protein PK35_00520 [Tamlana nanhaiensis]
MPFLLFSQHTASAKKNEEISQIHIRKTTDKIVINGSLDELSWRQSQLVSGFNQYFPKDNIDAIGDTEIMMCYDDNFLYVAAKCYSSGKNFRVESLKRDFSFSTNDNVNFIFDTYLDRTNAFQFSLNAMGAQKEALISNGGKNSNAIDISWDNKWYGDSKIYDGYWVCELAIPFSSIRYKEGASKWGFNCYRNDVQNNEISNLTGTSRENNLMNLNFTADIVWEQPLKRPSQRVSLIPYTLIGASRDYEIPSETKFQPSFDVGGDVKLGITSSLNLDLTINPDFSQVEVDGQVNNLDRFEISLPEKRQFFLENADLFGSFGTNSARPFFSRRIGVSIDTLTENNIQNTIYGGLRLSGKLNKRLRIGLLSLQAASQRENDLPSFNYTVLAAQQQVFDRSNIAFILVNKQAFNSNRFGDSVDAFDRVAGIEYTLNTKNNYWLGKASVMKAMTPDDKQMKYNSFFQLEYNRRRFRAEIVSLLVGDGFDAEVGFVPRRDILMFSPEFDIRFFPKTKKIAQITFQADSRVFYKLGKDDNPIIEDFGLEEWQLKFDLKTSFSNNHNFDVSFEFKDFTLLRNFDPTRIQATDLFFQSGTKHKNTVFTASYESDVRKAFSYQISPNAGRFYGGTKVGIEGGIKYRFQPFGSIAMDCEYTKIDIGGNFKKANFWLVGPRTEFTFSKKLFWTTFLQYNSRLNNLNINTRLQWRFAPASDFFLVWTDNYNTEVFSNFQKRNRALVAKLTYWLNI